jgi:hypothetical protein
MLRKPVKIAIERLRTNYLRTKCLKSSIDLIVRKVKAAQFLSTGAGSITGNGWQMLPNRSTHVCLTWTLKASQQVMLKIEQNSRSLVDGKSLSF